MGPYAPAALVLERRLAFERRHPEVKITGPSSESSEWTADWPGKGEDEPAGHITCIVLLEYLEARFDRGDLAETGETGDD
jgi:hypothetical protein